MTPEERRGALLTERPDAEAVIADYERRLTEKDADIAGLRALIEAYEHKFVAKNAEIERLQASEHQARSVITLHQQNGCGVQLDAEGLRVEIGQLTRIIFQKQHHILAQEQVEARLADERRRTAEEIAQQAEAVLDTDHLFVTGTNSLADAFTAGVKHASRIAREVGNSA